MKKKIILALCLCFLLIATFAVAVSAAEPDTTKETVTLADGTVCPIWDTDENGLIWYVSGTNEAGGNIYSYVSATSSAVDYKGNWTGTVYGATVYEVGTITLTVDGTSYGVDKMVVMNLMKDVKITSNKCIGSPVNCFNKTFYNSKTLQYLYLPVDTVSFQNETIKGCSNLVYINFEDLTELRKFGSQDLNGCSSLCANGTLDLTNTHLIEIGNNGLANTKAAQILLPNTIEKLGNSVFENCSNLTSINLPASLTSLTNTNYTFSGCTSLQTITGMANVVEKGNITSFGLYTFNGCKALKNIDGFMTDGILIIPEGFTSVSTLAFYECDQIKFVEFPSTINYVGQACFGFCDNLVLVSFDKVDAKIRNAIANGESYTKVTFNNCGTFKGCPKLVALSVPEGTTEIINRFVAQGCNSLTAFYMPNSVTYFGSNGGDQGSFCNAKNLYFVQEPFTVSQCLVNGEIDLSKLNLPEKPEIYYMPTSLCRLDGHIETNQYSKDGTIFKNCTSLNSVLVFGENFRVMNANNMFQGMGTSTSPKTVVFTADITQFIVTNKNANYIDFVFVNSADKTPADLGITRIKSNDTASNSYFYFCQTGLKYSYNVKLASEITDPDAINAHIATWATANETKHVREADRDETNNPDCVNTGSIITYCFCSAKMGTVEIPALGHDKDKELSYNVWVWENNDYFANANYKHVCQVCAEEYVGAEIENSHLFVKQGYAKFENKDENEAIVSYDLQYSIRINQSAITLYKNETGNVVKYGTVAGVGASVNNPLKYENEEISSTGSAVYSDMTGTDFVKLVIKVANVPVTTEGIEISCNAYAIIDNKLRYVSDGTVYENAYVSTIK